VTGGSNKRISLAALIAVKPGCQPRLIYRVHKSRRRSKDKRKGFTETGYAQLLDAAHQHGTQMDEGNTLAEPVTNLLVERQGLLQTLGGGGVVPGVRLGGA
jgi:hypothetical protein